MKYLAAYMLLSLGGKSDIAAADVEALLGSAGLDVDAEALATMMAKVEGKDLTALIASGEDKLLAIGGGGGAAAPAAGGAAPAAGGKAAAKKEEEKKEEPVEVDLGGGGLFGGAAAAY
jgi:large subunit ribosomal protein LP2